MDISLHEGDDPAFITYVKHILLNVVDRRQPTEVFVVRVDNWFDHKWLGFSGKGVVQFPEREVNPGRASSYTDSALDEFRSERLTLPPFTPKRILEQQYYLARGLTRKRRYLPYKGVRESSDWNIRKPIVQLCESGVFVWFSSKTRSNGRGSVMVYTVEDKDAAGWYASFSSTDSWRLDQVKGIQRAYVECYLEEPKD